MDKRQRSEDMNYIKKFMNDNYIDYERPVRLSEDITVALMKHDGELYIVISDKTSPTQYRVEQINPIFVKLLSGEIEDLRTKAQPFLRRNR